MIFHIITIFPESFDSYLRSSVIGRAVKKNLITINLYNLRDYTLDKHQKVDDAPYGGGAGMILQVEPIWQAVEAVKIKIKENNVDEENIRVILFSAKGKTYRQTEAERLKQYGHLIMICGRYEGVDERVADHIADEEISVGDYILSGGEIPALVVLDSVSRLLPDVLGNAESIEDESFSARNTVDDKYINYQDLTEYPQYTRPEDFRGWKVPEILLGGHHDKIKKWRESKRKKN